MTIAMVRPNIISNVISLTIFGGTSAIHFAIHLINDVIELEYLQRDFKVLFSIINLPTENKMDIGLIK